ncbi:MAG: type I 3-dehydroquinate dehydratase [Caldimicrobium sp.]|nr:type I 3-dehydroquinate dehydratase [Caldimicrobium sp.]MCX7613012.1 type I 3-dehydroquinate dehydratase [Caldimicrobium sp.]MDW8182285.1 type I 3-dehydroquinate dehydratase [Caldimicrobium sp.]
MFCLVLAERDPLAIPDVIEKYRGYTSFFELRLDFWEDFSEGILREILSDHSLKIISTFRSKEEGGAKEVPLKERLRILKLCSELGSYLVDVEWQTYLRSKTEVRSWKAFPKRILFSYHNFTSKPSNRALKSILRRASREGLMKFKITTVVREPYDALELLNIIPFGQRLNLEVIAFGMGEKGKWSRIAALFIGAPFIYVFPPEGREIAPGQMDLFTAMKIYEVFRDV